MQKNNIISSTNNNKISELIKIRDYKKYRDDKNLIFLEGERLINDTNKDLLVSIFISEDYNKDISHFNNIDKYIVSQNVFNKIKDTKTSQGIIAVSKKPTIIDYQQLLKSNVSNIVFIDNVKDPGNLGTIFRSCEASNIIDIVLTSDCCDAFMPKVLRASMSSVFRINLCIVDDYIEFINLAKKYDYNVLATILDSNNNYYNYDFYKQKNIIIFGNEANGIRNEILDICDEKITIPMSGAIESLNVSISCALVLYEINRQKNMLNEK